jgi:transposase
LAYGDETPWPERDKRRYMWTVVAALIPLTAYCIAKRSRKAFKKFLPKFKGNLHCDRYGSYKHLKNRRIFCWAHLKRDFKRLTLRGGTSKEVGEIGLRVHKQIFKHWKAYKAGNFDRKTLPMLLEAAKTRLQKALRKGLKAEEPKTAGFCANLLADQRCVWNFSEIENAEPTNNRAEGSVRLAAILRKLSFGTDSKRGSRFMERMLTIIECCRRQGKNALEYVQKAIEARQGHLKNWPSLLAGLEPIIKPI